MQLIVKNIVRIAVALFFISSGLLKIFSFSDFVLSVHRFNILPASITLPFSIFIVFTELISGTGLLLNVQGTMISYILVFLLTLFSVAIIINLFHNNIIDCGCFGGIAPIGITWWSVVRNLLICLLLIWFARQSTPEFRK